MAKLQGFNDYLIEISESISYDDKVECRTKTGVSVFTINQYLRGQGVSIGTATKLTTYFKAMLKKRSKLLTA